MVNRNTQLFTFLGLPGLGLGVWVLPSIVDLSRLGCQQSNRMANVSLTGLQVKRSNKQRIRLYSTTVRKTYILILQPCVRMFILLLFLLYSLWLEECVVLRWGLSGGSGHHGCQWSPSAGWGEAETVQKRQKVVDATKLCYWDPRAKEYLHQTYFIGIQENWIFFLSMFSILTCKTIIQTKYYKKVCREWKSGNDNISVQFNTLTQTGRQSTLALVCLFVC